MNERGERNDPPSAADGDDGTQAGEELRQAADHLKAAASALWRRATRDERPRRVLRELTERAEPIAREVSDRVALASQQLLEWVVPEEDPAARDEGSSSDENPDDHK